jgi:hypothetical protein
VTHSADFSFQQKRLGTWRASCQQTEATVQVVQEYASGSGLDSSTS